MSDLPKGWVESTLDELFDFNPRHNSSTDKNIPISFIPMPIVCDREGIIRSHPTRLLEEIWKGYTHFQDRDVIFAKITPCMENGKIAIANNLHNGLACGSSEFHVLRSKGIVLSEYLWRFLRQTDFRQEAAMHMTGAVGQRRVPLNFLKETTLPVPPLAEQHRIVAKLDSLLDRSRRARQDLDRIPKLLDRYKQAILSTAFSGNLTADWREKYNLNFDWKYTTLGSLLIAIESGKNLRCEERHLQASEKGVIKISAVSWGKFRPEESKTWHCTVKERSREARIYIEVNS